ANYFQQETWQKRLESVKKMDLINSRLSLGMVLFILSMLISGSIWVFGSIVHHNPLFFSGFILFICTLLGFSLREFLIFLVILARQPTSRNDLIITGLRSIYLIVLILIGIILFFNAFMAHISVLVLHGTVWGLNRLLWPPTLPIGKSGISIWPFN
ncbi:MAG: hypothetical protein ACFFBD_09600, partial [Candidatus Hodarchaeota archaeon]